jgi:hypothetical protein
MNSSQYFCNLYQAYLMITNNFKFSHITATIYKGDIVLNVPGNDGLVLFLKELPKITTVSINTNYRKSHPHSLKELYYRASEIEALTIHEKHYPHYPLYSKVRESKDETTLLITRGVYL